MALQTNRRMLLGGAPTLPTVRSAHVKVGEVVISQQFGTLYLQRDVMQSQPLVERPGGRLGLPNLRASFVRFAGTGLVTEALLSGNLPLASGIPGALLL